MIICYEVEGLPPKYDSASSMWGNQEQAKRLVRLRERVKHELGNDIVFTENIRMFLMMHAKNHRQGDLDNFISGVCNGLMTIPTNANIHQLLQNHQQVGPTWYAIIDDRHIGSISAERTLGHNEHYQLILQGDVGLRKETA